MATLPATAPSAPVENGLRRLVGHLSNACGVAAAFMILAAVLITCQMITVRYLLGQSTVWQTEAVVYLSIGATLIGLPYVQRLRGHVAVDLLSEMLPRPIARLLAIVTLALSILLAGVMAYYSFEFFHTAWSRGWRSDTVWGPPLWVPYLALPIGFGTYALQLAADLWGTASEEAR